VSNSSNQLLIGTHNVGKANEITSVLSELNFTFVNLRDVGIVHAVSEHGATYEENAVLKAEAYARESGLLTLADDSGLEVEALNRAPGVISARYAGKDASDLQRINFLLGQLENIPPSDRSARFVSVVAVADPARGLIGTATGICEGTIIRSPRGHNGFGYDPIFVPNGFEVTFAELPASTKDVISHRAKSLQAIKSVLAAHGEACQNHVR
jgi:XTP/dITP diphosphohydrolase